MATMIVFETFEGQTGKIARFAAEKAKALGRDVRLVDTSDQMVAADFDGVDKIILAAPVHERRHPKNFEVFVSASLPKLKAVETLMLSVSLKAAFEDGLEEARDYLTEMEMRTGFTPTREELVAGAVRVTSYDYFSSQIVEHVVLRGQEPQLSDGEQEFTDWDALARALSDFLSNG